MIEIRKIIIWGIFFFYSVFVHCQEDFYHLKGSINKKYDNTPIMLFTFYDDTIRSVDTTIVKNGTFHFEGKEYIKDYSLLTIGNYPYRVISLEVILEKGNTIVSMDNKRIIEGGKLHNLYITYMDTVMTYSRQVDKLIEEQGNEKVEKGTPVYDKYAEWGHYTLAFKKANITNLIGQKEFRAGAWKSFPELYAFGLDSAFHLVLDVADEELKGQKWIGKQIKSGKERVEKMKMQNSLIGEKIIDFEFQTPEKEKRKLSDYIGLSDALVIDFWASWCGPCIAEMPRLKKTYNKYKDKGLVVISISLDDSKKVWDKAMAKVNVPWIHLCDFNGNRSELTKAYNISAIPFILLIDKNGTIIDINLRGDSLDESIEALIKK